jgi:hypothetical protein
MTGYSPGECNINHRESVKRYVLGSVALALGSGPVILLALVSGYPSSSSLMYYLIFSLVLNFAGALFVLQGRNSFCVMHAREGTEKTGEDTEGVSYERAVSADKGRANVLILESAVLGVFLTFSVYVMASVALV